MIRRAMDWHRFWFAPESASVGSRHSQSGVRVEMYRETTYLVWPEGIRIRATPQQGDVTEFVDVRGISQDQDFELHETAIFAEREARGNGSGIVSECRFELTMRKSGQGMDRAGASVESWYRKAILDAIRGQAQWLRCPCTIWIARVMEGDLKGFVLISDGR
jgi:hypothetical protein